MLLGKMNHQHSLIPALQWTSRFMNDGSDLIAQACCSFETKISTGIHGSIDQHEKV
jgi:hypothetical protein